MLFKADTQHALRALTVLASERVLLPKTALAEKVGAPEPALAKVLQRLSQHGLVSSRPGPGGGYALARGADQIVLLDIVHLFEGPYFGRDCVFGLPRCSDEEPCPLHEGWKQVLQRILGLLGQHTVASLAEGRVPAQPWPSEGGGRPA